jgi:hypothetical protein
MSTPHQVPAERAHALGTPTDAPRNGTDVLDLQEKDIETEVLVFLQKHLGFEAEGA